MALQTLMGRVLMAKSKQIQVTQQAQMVMVKIKQVTKVVEILEVSKRKMVASQLQAGQVQKAHLRETSSISYSIQTASNNHKLMEMVISLRQIRPVLILITELQTLRIATQTILKELVTVNQITKVMIKMETTLCHSERLKMLTEKLQRTNLKKELPQLLS